MFFFDNIIVWFLDTDILMNNESVIDTIEYLEEDVDNGVYDFDECANMSVSGPDIFNLNNDDMNMSASSSLNYVNNVNNMSTSESLNNVDMSTSEHDSFNLRNVDMNGSSIFNLNLPNPYQRRIDDANEKIIADLKKQLKLERARNSRLKHKFKNRKTPRELAYDMVKPLLTENQIQILLKRKKWVRWTPEEIATAFSLAYISRRY